MHSTDRNVFTNDEILERARTTPLTPAGVRDLLAVATADGIAVAFERALDRDEIGAATTLAFALAACGQRLPRDGAIRLLVDLEHIEHFAPLAAACDGDRFGMLIDLVEQGRLSYERQALALHLAALQVPENEEPPRRLIKNLRLLAREPLGPEAASLVGLTAVILKNGDIEVIAPRVIALGHAVHQSGAYHEYRQMFFAPALDSLPEHEPPRVLSGYTFARAAPKVGRNDLCPCGSGRKFKKCCGQGGETAASPPSLREQLGAAKDRRIRQQIFDSMRPSEVARLDPTRLTTLELIGGMRRLFLFRRWKAAEEFTEVLAQRDDAPGGPSSASDYRLELADAALEAGELELAEKHFELSHPDENERRRFSLALALARCDPDSLSRLEAAATLGLGGGKTNALFDCAFTLLDHSPALGILVARGCLSPERMLDSETLLLEVGKARDRLALDPEEEWWEIYDFLVEDRTERLAQARSHSASDNERARLARELSGLRSEIAAHKQRVRDLEGDLCARQKRLEDVASERHELESLVQKSRGVEREEQLESLEAERRRLRQKIEELQGEISEGASQRIELRRQLARVSESLRGENATPAGGGGGGAAESDASGDEGQPVHGVPRGILVPVYATAAARALAQMPRRIAAAALRSVASLSAGDEQAWRAVKHTQSQHGLLRYRVGRDHRLLFRHAEETLEVLDFVDRKDLDAAIERLRR